MIFNESQKGNVGVSSDDKVFEGPPNLTLLDKRRVRSFVAKLCPSKGSKESALSKCIWKHNHSDQCGAARPCRPGLENHVVQMVVQWWCLGSGKDNANVRLGGKWEGSE